MKFCKSASVALLLTLVLALTACGGASYRDDLSAGQVAQAISDAIPSEGRHAADEDYISESSFGADGRAVLFEKTDSRMILLSDRADSNIDEIGVFHVTSESDVSEVRKILEEYIAAQSLRLRTMLESYNPTEIPKLDCAAVTVYGQYVVYTVLSSADTEAAQVAATEFLTVGEGS